MKRLLYSMMIMTGWALTACGAVSGPSTQAPQALAAVKASLAQAYWAQGQSEEALRQIEQAVALTPNTADLWLLRAELHRQQGLAQPAQESYAQALRLAPAAGAPNHHYGWYLCHVLGQPDAAAVYFERARLDAAYPHRAQVAKERAACVQTD